jgi:hypothetical protein
VRTEESAVRKKVIVTILFLSSMSAIAANLTPAEAAKHVGANAPSAAWLPASGLRPGVTDPPCLRIWIRLARTRYSQI